MRVFLTFLMVTCLTIDANAKGWNSGVSASAEVAKKKYGWHAKRVCERLSCNKKMVWAIMVTENQRLDPKVVSGAGAVGLLQIKPSVAREVGVTDDLSDPFTNIFAAMKYYLSLETRYRFKGQKQLLLAYKEGPTRARRMLREGYDINRHLYVKRVLKALRSM